MSVNKKYARYFEPLNQDKMYFLKLFNTAAPAPQPVIDHLRTARFRGMNAVYVLYHPC